MKQYLLIIVLCLPSYESMSMEKCNIIGVYDMYFSGEKYTNPFPYDIAFKCNGTKYEWNGSSIIIHAQKNCNEVEYNQLVDKIPSIIYDFKKNFFKNSESYFKYLIKSANDTIQNNIDNDVDIRSLKSYFNNRDIFKAYNNPFNKNPFIFKLDNAIFTWKNSQIFMKHYNNKYRKLLSTILINFNDSFQYFIYLLRNVANVSSYSINIIHDNITKDNYKSLIFNTAVDNPFDKIIIIKDCLRTYRWNKNSIEIVFPDWLDDNLSKNNYSIFLQLLETATNKFNKGKNKHNNKSKDKELDDLAYCINQEFGNNILVYALNLDSLGWETIDNVNNPWVSSVTNYDTGFEEIEYKKLHDNYIDNDKDDF